MMVVLISFLSFLLSAYAAQRVIVIDVIIENDHRDNEAPGRGTVITVI